MSRYANFTDNEMYMLHRMAIECGFEIMMDEISGKEKYDEDERKTYNDLAGEIEMEWSERLKKVYERRKEN